jgi:murein DD-endopeptidase MepM/ murein hydrolase activator NlpD
VAAPGWKVGPAPAAERAEQARRAAEPTARAAEHVVSDGETLYSVARRYHVDVSNLAAANHVGLDHHVRIGERLVIPGAGRAEARIGESRPAERPQATKATVQEARVEARPATPNVARPDMTRPAAPSKVEPERAATPTPTKADSADITASTGTVNFRWPVRGRIISGFGPKPNGTTNDGINLAVPEGTPVQAAAGGVVAYAGNELKGYGNLVLIRHPGGWVTAYAHNSAILVKKGEEVRRGEVIAKSGRSGAVDAPQLHFELRRGATPVDPLSHMPQG